MKSAPIFWVFFGLVFSSRWCRASAAGGAAAEGRRQRRAGGYPPGLNLIVADSYRFVALCLMALCSVTLAVKF